ncbi:DoxX family membrane protein [Flavobacterium sp. AG291]|uniref:DoxX family membrane protein n=1 Tax=Flavobacterium sp. AG291 TaxID=2184000 RepID=UPI000E0C5946|nr:DoxX family membrane protein [Flavobacterium sp. AG291]RDI15855.1 DoxX-like protein [Flavobacterium sp. AG291]
MKNKIVFVVSLLFGLLFIVFGMNKFLNFMPPPPEMPEHLMKVMGAFMTIGWLMPLVGIAEVVGGVLFIIPKTRAFAAVMVFPVMVGIMLTNTVTDTSGLPIALVFFVINLWVLYENRHKYAPMFTE